MLKRDEPGRFPAIVLAVIVHLLFFGLLIFGVTWKNKEPEAVTVDLWNNLPPTPKAAHVPAPQPRPQPEKKVEPEPEKPKPEPKPERPKPEPKPEKKEIPIEPEPKPQPAKPDIQLKEQEEKRRLQEKQRQAMERREEEKLKQQALKEQQAQVAEQLREQEEALAAAQQAQAQQASAQGRVVADYKQRIQSKIHSKIVLPPELIGNPQAEFDVVLLPSGDVLSVKLARPSGVPAYDSAVERAIYKAQALPLPPDRTLFREFRELHLKFRAKEEG